MSRRSTVGIAVLVVCLAIGLGAFLLSRHSTSYPPEWEGPAGLVVNRGTARLCMVIRQEEKRFGFTAGSSRLPFPRQHSFFHFSVRCHDPVTAQLLSTDALATLSEADGGRVAQGRILGQEGEFLWLFLNGEPVAIQVADGRIAASRPLLERHFPRLRGKLPVELAGYGFDAGLVFTTTAAEPLRLTLGDLQLRPYDVPSERWAIGRNAQWNGRLRTRDFLIRRAASPAQWLGLYTAREAEQAAADEFGDNYRDDGSVLDEGPATRRSWWRAEIGRTREFSEGSHPRLTALKPTSDGQTYLGGGLLKRAGQPAVLEMTGPGGWLVVHVTRIDAEGRIVVTRVNTALQPLWSTTLPFGELTNRWELPGRLLLMGQAPPLPGRDARLQEFIVSLDLARGGIATWNIGAEAP